jgi:glycosyltransferase involved in cell wall biosynthesis
MAISSTKPKLLYIVTRSVLGGVASHISELMSGFRPNYDLALVVGEMGPLVDIAQDLGVDCYILPSLNNSLNPWNDFRSVRDCVGLIKQIQPDLIHAHSSKAGTIARIAAAITRKPIVFTAHGWGFTPGIKPLQRGLVWAAELLMSRLTDKIICVSEYDRCLALKYKVGNRRKLATVYNGIPDNAPIAQPEQLDADGKISIVMTARFEPQKDPFLAIRACQQLPAYVRLITIGDGSLLAPAQKLAQELGISDRVLFLGNRRDVPEILAQSQIFLLSTHYEGLPISIIEAMRAGLPVVASNVGGVCEEVIDGENGFLVPPRDVNALVADLNKLVHDPQLRRKMGRDGRHKFLELFTCERTTHYTQSVYDRILPKPCALPLSPIPLPESIAD